jgi:hypothetical protein
MLLYLSTSPKERKSLLWFVAFLSAQEIRTITRCNSFHPKCPLRISYNSLLNSRIRCLKFKNRQADSCKCRLTSNSPKERKMLLQPHGELQSDSQSRYGRRSQQVEHKAKATARSLPLIEQHERQQETRAHKKYRNKNTWPVQAVQNSRPA